MDSPILPDEVLLQESLQLPSVLLKQGRRSEIETDTSRPVFLIRFATALLMSPQDALAVGEWLVENATALLESRAVR